MSCNECGEKPKKACGAFPKAVIEIDNPEKIVLLRKVMVPASMGDESTFPPTIGKYHNVLLEYETSGGIYLYSSDGIPTKLSSDVTELQAQLNALRVRVGEEEVARADADTTLSNRITSLDNSLATVAKTGSYNDLSNKPTIGNGTLTIKKNGSNVGTFTANTTTNTDVNIVVPTKTSDLANDGSDGTSQYVESNGLSTVATSGSYNDLTNKPTIGNATLTIKRNNTNAGTFTANATTNKSIDIAVPTKTSDLTNDGADGTSTYVESDDLPTVDTTYSSSSNNAIANSTVTNSLDRNVMTDLAVNSTPSTTTVNLSNTKTNLAYPSSSTTSSISLPVASSTQAGVMNSATFDAVTSNTNNINAILNGAVAISNLPASPTQAQLTTAWENETGLTSLINRASVYDVTNNKVWTYYTNDQTWHAASNTSQVTVNTFTNSSEGTIKGSTNDGQVFAENDGTGSVNGWDTLTSAVSSNTSKLATIAQGAEVNVQANWTQTNTSADDYIKNKPANLVQDANYVHTDNNFTTTLKNKLDGIESGAEVNVQADWSQTDTTADDYIKNKPTIPTVNNATLTIQKNGTNVQTFTANSSTNKTANITVPTAVSELTNDSGYATTTQLNDGLATKQNTLTAGDNIQINGNTISAANTTYTAGNAIDITNGEISADIHPADFFTAESVVSDCGSDLSLDGTIASTLESVELKGDTFQQTYTGKNLSPYPYYSGDSHGSKGITFTAASDGSVTLNGTNDGTGNSSYYIYSNPSSLLQFEAGTYYFIPPLDTAVGYVLYDGTTYYDFDSSNNYSRTFPNTKSIRQVYIQVRNGDTAVFDNLKIYPMLTTSPNQTEADYEPYTGSTPSQLNPAPNPDYPQDVKVITGEQTVKVSSKNLLPVRSSTTTNGITFTTNPDGSVTINGTATGNAFFDLNRTADTYTELKMGTTYTLSAGAELPSNVRFITRSVSATTQYMIINASDTSRATKTMDTDVSTFTYIGVYSAGTTINNLTIYPQLEIGSAPTRFEKHSEQIYPLSLGNLELCKIGDYQDYIYKSGNDWYLYKEIGKIILDGTGNYATLSDGDHGEKRFKFTDSTVGNIGVDIRSTYCDAYQGVQYSSSKSTPNSIAQWSQQNMFAITTNKTTYSLNDFKADLASNPATVYYVLETPTDTKITDATLVGQLEALAEAKSYNDQTNIIVTAAGGNLPTILCVEAHRKSLSGVIEAIDSACTCRKNLVVHLPNGMTTYENNDAPIPIPEVLEAIKRGQSVFLVDDALYESIYVVTAVDAADGIYSMRADQTGVNPRGSDGHWHISGGGDVWDSVTFINDATPSKYSPNIYNKTWFAFTNSTPLLDQSRRTYYPASSDMTFNNSYGNLSVAELWEKLASSAWNGNPVVLEVPLQDISTRTTSLVDNGFSAESPYLTISVSLGPDNYFERETSESTITGWAAEWTPLVYDRKGTYTVGIVRVVGNGNTTYSFVVSLTEVEDQ